MRTFRNAAIAVLIVCADFVMFRRVGLTAGSGVVIFATMAAGLVWAAKEQSRATQRGLQNAVASIGFQPAERDDVTLPVYPLRGDGWVEAAAHGELRGLEAWIFSYVIRLQRNDPDPVFNIRQTVVAFRVEGANLPVFQIRPLQSSSIFDADWKNYEGDWENSDDTICFPDALLFHRHYELVSSAEEGVRRFFTAQLLDAVAALDDGACWVKGYNTTVLLFTPKRIVRPDEMEAFARKGADIAYAIFSARKRVMAAIAK